MQPCKVGGPVSLIAERSAPSRRRHTTRTVCVSTEPRLFSNTSVRTTGDGATTTASPVSSRTSRTTHSSGASPKSTPPPGRCHLPGVADCAPARTRSRRGQRRRSAHERRPVASDAFTQFRALGAHQSPHVEPRGTDQPGTGRPAPLSLRSGTALPRIALWWRRRVAVPCRNGSRSLTLSVRRHDADVSAPLFTVISARRVVSRTSAEGDETQAARSRWIE